MKEKKNRVSWLRLGVVFLAILAAVVAAAPASAEGEGRCATAVVPGPIVLPDGSVEPAGKLTLCLSRSYSPVAGLHKTSIDGRVVGMFVSRRGTSEAAIEEHVPYFVFLRDAHGRYELQSYAWPSNDRYLTFNVRDESQVRSHWMAVNAAGPSVNEDPISVLIAGY